MGAGARAAGRRRRRGARRPPPLRVCGSRLWELAAAGAGHGAKAHGQPAAAVGCVGRRRRRSWPCEPAAAGAGRGSRRASPDPPSSCLAGAPRSGGGAPRSGGAQGGATAPDPVELEEALHGVRAELEKVIHGGDRANAAELEEGRGRAAPWSNLQRHGAGDPPEEHQREHGAGDPQEEGAAPRPRARRRQDPRRGLRPIASRRRDLPDRAWICGGASTIVAGCPPEMDTREVERLLMMLGSFPCRRPLRRPPGSARRSCRPSRPRRPRPTAERAYFFCLSKILLYRLVFTISTNGCLKHRVKNLVS